ncbi:MAG: hypothetical protein C0469_03285 [Cyanobacteria bacterium DS2.3.42]|nr:hypothetical protein [Cyanobacteria bacterium DS2.3.42]
MADRFRIAALMVVLVTVQFFCVVPSPAKPEISVSKRDKAQFAVSSKSSGAKGKVDPQSKGDTKVVVPAFSFNGAKEVDGLVLQQEYRFIGKSTTYFSPLGIRLESTTLSVLFNSKTQVMCIYSDETKKFYACDPETWKKKSKILFKNPTEHGENTDWKFLRNETVAGMKTKVYQRFSYLKAMTNEDTLWLTDEIKLTKEARSLLFALLKVMDTVPDGIPLRHALSSKHKQVKDTKADFLGRRRVRQSPDTDRVDYQTFTIKKVKIPVSKYVMPPSYKRAESEMEIFFNEDAMGGPEMLDLDSDQSKRLLQKKFK